MNDDVRQALADLCKDKRPRAYEIYLQRGQQPGYEVDDWLQAEREINS